MYTRLAPHTLSLLSFGKKKELAKITQDYCFKIITSYFTHKHEKTKLTLCRLHKYNIALLFDMFWCMLGELLNYSWWCVMYCWCVLKCFWCGLMMLLRFSFWYFGGLSWARGSLQIGLGIGRLGILNPTSINLHAWLSAKSWVAHAAPRSIHSHAYCRHVPCLFKLWPYRPQ